MSPEFIAGGTAGHAASGTAKRRDAACADDLRVLARCATLMSVTIGALVLNAPILWPHLFAH